jgi:PKD repeat protein
MSTSTERNPTHVYTQAGVYSVTLTVFGVGGTDSYTRSGYISVGTPQYYISLDGLVPPGSATVTGFGTYPDGASVSLQATGTAIEPPYFADIVFLVDESGSMSTEHTWLATLPGLLEAALLAEDIGTSTVNRYALLGFGSTDAGHGTPPGNEPHKHTVGGGDWGTAAQLQTAAGGLVLIGGDEDGYDAATYALNNYTFRSGAAKMFILITDEDRKDITGGTVTRANTLTALLAAEVIFASVLDLLIKSNTNVVSIGRKATTVYIKDLSPPLYTTGTFGTIQPGQSPFNPDNANVVYDYCDFTETLQGSEWDLNALRNGGSDAASFTAAFVEIVKAQIVQFLTYTFDHWLVNGVPYYTNPLNFTISGNTTVILYMTPP